MKLSGAKIKNCRAKEAYFIETDLSGSDLRKTDFEKAQFHETKLKKADLRGAKNYFIDLKNNQLAQARFSLPEVINLLEGLEIKVEA